jgi:hypothetical protein
VRRRLAENHLKPWRKDMWCVAQVDGSYVAHMVSSAPMSSDAQFPPWQPVTSSSWIILRAHKVAGVREAIEAAGATLLYVPPYSPDLNPIEELFAKLKVLLRKAAERTVDALWAAIGRLREDLPADECARYLGHAGYASI